MKYITKWLTESHNWKETVFSDEKRFSLDRPTSWYMFIKADEANIRQIRQCEGGGVLVLAIVIPNVLISHEIIRGNLKATNYYASLKNNPF